MLGIGPTGLLVESNGNFGGGTPPYYENLLGAGTGAVGLPKPSSPVDTTALVAAQYLGFFYGSGIGSQQGSVSSPVASFGFPTVLATCKTAVAVEPAAGTLIYGGSYANNNPATATGYPTTCNAGIDLGTEDPNNNGLYPGARIYFGTSFLGNQIGTKYNIPAVAIAGQLNGKYAIFVVGVDTTGTPQQAWGYLFAAVELTTTVYAAPRSGSSSKTIQILQDKSIRLRQAIQCGRSINCLCILPAHEGGLTAAPFGGVD